MNEKEERLLQEALFGEITEESAKELERLLWESPEAARKLQGLRRVAGLLQEVPAEEVPPNLVSNVMAALPRERLLVRLYRQARARLLSDRCPYYFLFIGVIHLLLGASLASMLEGRAGAGVPAWLSWQPGLALGAGAFFILCGLLQRMRLQLASRISYYGLLVYILLVSVNALVLLLQGQGGIPASGVLAYAGMGLTVGALLGALLQTANKDMGNGST